MGPITQGKDFNFFQKVTVSNAAFSNDSDVTFDLRGLVSFSLINEGTGVVEYSFNGSTLHGDLTPSTPSAAIFFDNRRVSAIWFRLKSGSPSVVRVEGWAGF